MVTAHLSWEALAHELFEQEWRRVIDAKAKTKTRASDDAHARVKAEAETETEAQALDATPGLDDPIGSLAGGRAIATVQAEVKSEAPSAPRAMPRLAEPPRWLFPELVQLLAEAPEQPVDELAPVIHELIAEHQFVETAGDPVVEPHHQQRDQAVRMCLDVLVRVRRRLRERTGARGAWADMPTTPQMFG